MKLMFNQLAKYTLVIRTSLPVKAVPYYMNIALMTFEYGINFTRVRVRVRACVRACVGGPPCD